jgi:ADP-heptose:LPS heptosyltransferase
MQQRYCIFRSDAIGDLILTLPMAFAIKAHNPLAQVSYCVQEYTQDLAMLCPAIDDVLSIPSRDVQGNSRSFSASLKERSFSTAIFAYPRPFLALAAKLALIPGRIGTAYRFYSFLFTHKQYEHRRGGSFHESEYNLHLLQSAGIPEYRHDGALLHITEFLSEEAALVLRSCGFGKSPYIILHPGSGGSAKDWDVRSFAALGASLAESYPGHGILVTGTLKEADKIRAVVESSGPMARRLTEELPLNIFSAVIANAAVLVANSTGPLHIAAALGIPVVGLYPDDPALSPQRWGPLGNRNAILTPQSIAGKGLTGNGSMSHILVQHVKEAVDSILMGT